MTRAAGEWEAPGEPPLLEVRGLVRRPLLDGRDLVLARGEIVVLSGPSGAGKTLFLRAIADLDPVEAGTVRLAGVPREALAPAEWRRRVLYVHPGGVRLPGSVGANLAAVERLAANAGRGAPVAAGADRALGLDADAQAERLSSGEGQRLALARALLVGPDVLLLDEPTSALDPERARAIERRLREWVAGGRAALVVSHDAGLAGRLGARAEVLERPPAGEAAEAGA